MLFREIVFFCIQKGPVQIKNNGLYHVFFLLCFCSKAPRRTKVFPTLYLKKPVPLLRIAASGYFQRVGTVVGSVNDKRINTAL